MKNEKVEPKDEDVVKTVGAQNLVPVSKELGDEIRPKKLSHNAKKVLLGLNKYHWGTEKKK